MWWRWRRENYKTKALLYWTWPAKLQKKEDIMDLRSIWKFDDERRERKEEETYQRRTCKRRRQRLRVWSWRSLWRACRRRNRLGWREDRRREAWDSATNLTVWETWRKGIGEGRVWFGLVLRLDWSLKENSRKWKATNERGVRVRPSLEAHFRIPSSRLRQFNSQLSNCLKTSEKKYIIFWQYLL